MNHVEVKSGGFACTYVKLLSSSSYFNVFSFKINLVVSPNPKLHTLPRIRRTYAYTEWNHEQNLTAREDLGKDNINTEVKMSLDY